jgi:hypothetical protein
MSRCERVICSRACMAAQLAIGLGSEYPAMEDDVCRRRDCARVLRPARVDKEHMKDMEVFDGRCADERAIENPDLGGRR